MNDNNVTESSKFSVNLVAMLIIIGIALSILFVVVAYINKQNTSLTTVLTNADESKVAQYDQRKDITGTQVVSLTKGWSSENVYVTVKAGKTFNVYYNGADFSNPMDSSSVRAIIQGMNNKASDYYVNPSGVFKCEVVYNDKTDVMEGVVFTQL